MPAEAQAPKNPVSHLIPLDGTAWSVWREVALRSAGFPAEMVLAICDEALARSADLDGRPDDDESPYESTYAQATARLSSAIIATAADPAFREAVTWQNPSMAEIALGASLSPARRSKDRYREVMIASYLQRYCLKNDTIGFYGPVGWASVTPEGAGLEVAPGGRLLARQTAAFGGGAMDQI